MWDACALTLQNKIGRSALWLATAMIIAAAAFPYGAPWLLVIERDEVKRIRTMKQLILGATLVGALISSTAAMAAERTATLAVENMTCPSCPYIVKTSMETVSGVSNGNVSYRSAERSGGKEVVSKCRSRWSPYHYKKQKKNKN